MPFQRMICVVVLALSSATAEVSKDRIKDIAASLKAALNEADIDKKNEVISAAIKRLEEMGLDPAAVRAVLGLSEEASAQNSNKSAPENKASGSGQLSRDIQGQKIRSADGQPITVASTIFGTVIASITTPTVVPGGTAQVKLEVIPSSFRGTPDPRV